MGWVEDKFLDQIAAGQTIGQFWNDVRDSAGDALDEFNRRAVADEFRIECKECKSNGRYCVRVIKKQGQSIELFLNESAHTLMVRTAPAEEKEVCHYRLKSDRSGFEFFDDGGSISADEAGRQCHEPFLFNPFPASFLHPLTVV
jgi:hypothetical protein